MHSWTDYVVPLGQSRPYAAVEAGIYGWVFPVAAIVCSQGTELREHMLRALFGHVDGAACARVQHVSNQNVDNSSDSLRTAIQSQLDVAGATGR